ncbi:hypothetical protein I601_1947 [Nocardioides dokdonensis FR1436]|uniref:Glyoxalase/fosfomycin resistance/dioxygenase domain-containing protein n=1 Tax=Nocardioides dokdonensis FR1436 TaxID=1300347 RepID=A0A1A9GJX5_9ACTN|nr:VOC family protein [Nocardioides dokdonensis]ANH38376.1 hypothetical protein I601_1947 [Nocardioides dokdonensis FR1436]
MPVHLNPYLTLAGTAREAMTFYRSVLGGELELMSYGDMGAEGDLADKIMHASLTTPDGLALMASDVAPGEVVEHGSTVRISLSGDDEPTLRGWFDALAEGGEVHVPMEMQPWGDMFGQCADRFGIIWLVNAAVGDQTA